jgi:hypothetical protein
MLAGSPAASAVELLVPATAKRHGPCEDRSRWRFSIRPGDEDTWRLRIDVLSRGAGEMWSVYVSHNGVKLYSGSRISNQMGDVRARLRGDDGPDRDRFRFGAFNRASSEKCLGALVVP